jgi:tetratricopeptide (TPR) repeat protein
MASGSGRNVLQTCAVTCCRGDTRNRKITVWFRAGAMMPTDVAPPESSDPKPRTTAFSAFEAFSRWLEVIRKATVSVAVTIGVGLVVVLVFREVWKDGIVIEPVIVQLPDLKGAPTSDLASQQIAKHIDYIQKAGVSEWRKLYVDQGSNPIDLQVPGAPLTLRATVRELAALFGVMRPTIRASVVVRREPAGYQASVSMAGEMGARTTCEAADTPAGIDEILECIALSAIGFIDPKVAASYVFATEQRACGNLDTAVPDDVAGVAREEWRIRNRRDRCSFEKTQAVISRILERGRPEDLPWVPYVFGRIHLARAAALATIDRAQQLAELDQAIGRFGESLRRMPDSPTALAVLIDAYVRKGVSMHEATTNQQWTNERNSLLQFQLYLAESTFAEAAQKLNAIPRRRGETLDALVRRLEGHLIYRQWMLLAHRRTRSGMVSTAIGQPAELALLADAAQRYASAAAKGPISASLYTEWGNVLRASGDFAGAVEKYLWAADLNPADTSPRLNMAIAFLDRIEYGPAPADPFELLVALGASSDYLSWTSDGGPYPSFVPRITGALGRSGHVEDGDAFKKCMTPAVATPTVTVAGPASAPANAEIARWKATAELKYCVDRAIEQINNRIIAADRTPVAPTKVR